MPPEWAPHARCWMGWPSAALWGGLIEAVEAQYAAVAHAVARFEPVRMLADPATAPRARRALSGEVEVVAVPLDDAWLRDAGPTFVHLADGSVAGVCWRFNGWGGAAPDHARDAAVGARVCEVAGVPAIRSSLTLEGGAIHVDGEGTVLTTRSVVLNPNRNPGLTRGAAEDELARRLGARHVAWLPGDASEPGTNGHVDVVAAFTGPGAVLVERPDTEAARADRAALEAARDAAGRRLEVLEVARPALGRAGRWGWRYCASYVNAYVANGGVVMPGFGVACDAPARAVMAAAFPGREVAQVDVSEIASCGGGVHCITQQEPRPRAAVR